jgi:hypothetical protein
MVNEESSSSVARDLRRRWRFLKAALGPAQAPPRHVTHLYVSTEKIRQHVDEQLTKNFEALVKATERRQ